MNKFKVQLKSIKLFGYHGVLKEEKENGQNFEVDIKYKFEKHDAADEIDSTIDYSEIYLVAKKTFEAKQYDLIENLAQDIANAILAKFSAIKQVKATVWKANPPVGGNVASVGITAKSKR